MNAIAVFQQMYCIKGKSGGNAAVFRKEMKSLIKMFIAGRTMISAFPIMKKSLFTHDRNVFNNRRTVIMNLISYKATMRAGLRFALQGEGNM